MSIRKFFSPTLRKFLIAVLITVIVEVLIYVSAYLASLSCKSVMGGVEALCYDPTLTAIMLMVIFDVPIFVIAYIVSCAIDHLIKKRK
jgi:hypothetical protein